MSRYYSRDEVNSMARSYAEQFDVLRAVIVELAAAVAWMDKNGYQSKMLGRTLSAASVDPKAVEAFNVAKRERIAAWQAKQ